MDYGLNDCLCKFTGALESVLCLQPVKDVFFYGSHDGPIRCFSMRTGNRTQILRGHTSWVTDLKHYYRDFSPPSGEKKADDKQFEIDTSIKTEEPKKEGDQDSIKPANSSPNQNPSENNPPAEGTTNSSDADKKIDKNKDEDEEKDINTYISLLFSSSKDGTIKCWDIRSGQGYCKHTYVGHANPVNCIALWPNETASDPKNQLLFVSGAADGNILLWNAETEEILKVFSGHCGPINDIAISNKKLFTASADSFCKMIDLETGNCIFMLQPSDSPLSSIYIKDDVMILGNLKGEVLAYDIRTKEMIKKFLGHSSGVLTIDGLEVKKPPKEEIKPEEPEEASDAKSKRGTSAKSKKAAPPAKKPPPKKGKDAPPPKKKGPVVPPRTGFGADETKFSYLLTGSEDNTIIQWEFPSGKVIHSYLGHEDSVKCLSMDPKGRLFSGSMDHSVRVWDFFAVFKEYQQQEIIRDHEEREKKKAEELKKKLGKGKKKGKKKKAKK